MKNKRAFTLVELIVVIVIIGVILIFTLPNVTRSLERSKKEQMIEDGKRMIEKAKKYALSHTENLPTDTTCKRLTLGDIDESSSINASPYGETYDRENSYVKICLESVIEGGPSKYNYLVRIIDINSKHELEESSVNELNSDEKYTYVK